MAKPIKSMNVLKNKTHYFKGFGFTHVKVLTDENETVYGINLYMFKKQCLVVAIASAPWLDDDGKPYGFKLEKKILFMGKVAVWA